MTETLADAVAKQPKRGVGAVIKEAILAGKDNAEALEAARKEFPESATTAATVSWYRNDLRKDGHVVPTARELQKRKKDAEATAAAEAKAAADAAATAAVEGDPLA